MKLSTLLLPIVLAPFTLSQHAPLPMDARQQDHAPARRNGLTERDLVNFLRALGMAKRAPPTVADDENDAGLLGGLLGGASARPGSSSASSTGKSSGKPTASASDTDSDDDEDKGESSTTSGATSRGSSTLPTSSAANSTSASSISTTSSSAPPSSSAITSLSTDAEGQVKVVTQIITSTPSAAPSTSSAASQTDGKKDDSPISTPAIIGISVGAGAVVLTLIACAIWRMKRRRGDEDEAIRWPELNRHGDADTHHALPARITGQHGIETNPLERSVSNSSSVFAQSSAAPPMSAPPMALNGSGFGAASTLEDYEYHEKSEAPPMQNPHSPPPVYFGSPGMDEDDYANLPPAVGVAQGAPGMLAYDSESEEHGQQMSMAPGRPGVTRY